MAQPDWRAIHDRLSGRDIESLLPAELDELAESLFWLDRPQDSITVLGRAFRAHLDAGDDAGAAMAAWQLFYDHALVGEIALANGWLERARRSAEESGEATVDGFLAIAEADRAWAAGDLETALSHARRALDQGRATASADLVAMALQVEGRLLVALGRIDEGFVALDEAMVCVVNNELSPLFTGWVYCNALSACHDAADLSRAVQWSDAAMRWCGDLHDGRLYPGICRLHVVELSTLQGRWDDASQMAIQACEELTAHDVRYAGEAHYLRGELHRRAGDLDLAEEAYTAAHQLGRLPQPGLGLVRLAQGRVDAALGGLRSALDPSPTAPMATVELLGAMVECHLATGDLEAADEMAVRMAESADRAQSTFLSALAGIARARVLVERGDGAQALRQAARAVDTLRALNLPYDTGRAQVVRGAAARLVGDHDGADLDLEAAHDVFTRLGAEPDARHVRALRTHEVESPLSPREAEVLRLLARGDTNKQIASQLVVSEHTVARHLSNIYTKLGVGSRSAATAYAYEHALI